jgi:hypothetical protein
MKRKEISCKRDNTRDIIMGSQYPGFGPGFLARRSPLWPSWNKFLGDLRDTYGLAAS